MRRQAQRSSQRNGTSVVSEMKSRQAAKIRELGQSLIDENTFKRQDESVWNSETTQLSNQGLLERLEAENALLPRSMAELMLQIQALRDGELLRLVVQATVRS